MKQYFLLISIISLLAFSCDKVKKMEDDIALRVFNPFLALNPADSAHQIYYPYCDEYIPFPSDSVQSLEIDVDNNGQNDFRFTYSTSYEFVSFLDSCENHNSEIIIEALGMGNTVFMDSDHTPNVKIYDEDNKISAATPKAKIAKLYYDNASSSDSYDLEGGNKIIGIRLLNGELGWIKVFHDKKTMTFGVLEHAYNANIHLGIKAGQKN